VGVTLARRDTDPDDSIDYVSQPSFDGSGFLIAVQLRFVLVGVTTACTTYGCLI